MIPGIDRIEKKVIDLEHGRDVAMQTARDLIRTAGKVIALMHASGPGKASGMIRDLVALKSRLEASEKGFEYYTFQAHQEYSEAMILHGILSNKKMPTMEQIREGEVPYLLGLMDVIGELKREAIESLRKRKGNDAKLYYNLMSDIYDSTLHMRFSNSILPDFRRKQDSARIQLEGVMTEILHFEQGHSNI